MIVLFTDSTMAARALSLRLKAKNGQHTLKDITIESTLKDLKSAISELTKIPTRAMKILQGFPPRTVDTSDDGKQLAGMNLKSGDTLIVEEDPAIQAQAAARQYESLLHEMQAQYEAQGILSRKVVPANNSCLFTSINFVMGGGKLDLRSAGPMRQVIASVVSSDPVTYNDAFLGKQNDEYCAWILSDDTWGGAIEIAILTKYYQVEIDVVDTQTCRIDRFGEDQHYSKKVLLIYDGIHYDPLMMEPVDPSQSPYTQFSCHDEKVLAQAQELAAEAKSSRQFTDVSSFTLRCLVCQKCLTGQAEAQQHAQQTGHINFGEV